MIPTSNTSPARNSSNTNWSHERSGMSHWRKRIGDRARYSAGRRACGSRMTPVRFKATRPRPGHGRHHGAAQEHHLSRPTPSSWRGRSNNSNKLAKRMSVRLQAVLYKGSQESGDDGRALCPRQAVQAHEQRDQAPAHAPGTGHSRTSGARSRAMRPCEEIFAIPLAKASQIRSQKQRQRGWKLYSWHAPEVECIGKGKASQRPTSSASRSRSRRPTNAQGRPVHPPCQGAARQSL